MALLGGVWRMFREICINGRSAVWVALYILLIRMILMVELGFIIPFATALRYIVVTVVFVLYTTRRADPALAGRMTTPRVIGPARPRIAGAAMTHTR